MERLIDLVPLPHTDAVVAVGAAILGLTAGVLGAFAVLRQRSMVGDALSHATLPGVCAAFILTGVKEAGGLLAGAAAAGVVGALLMVGIERTGRIRPDAAIGVVLSSFFSLGIVLLTYIANSENANQAGLEKYLFGQAAGLLERDVVVMAALSLVALTAVTAGFRALKTTLFDPAYAGSIGLPVRGLEVAMTLLLVVAVIVGVRAVGAILMVALLVMPTVAARQVTARLSHTLPLAGGAGALIGVGGALLSIHAELPTGPVIVLFGFALVVTALLLAPGRGVLWRLGKLVRDRRRARHEGVLADLVTALEAGGPPTGRELALLTGRPGREIRWGVADLRRAGLVSSHGDRLDVTPLGAASARALRERRELWSHWLDHGWKLALPDAREPDPNDLRGSLGDEYVERLLAVETVAAGGRGAR